MFAFRFRHVRIESFALHLPETVVTSAEIEDRLSPLYEKLKIPFGTLEKVSGVQSRRLWPSSMMPSTVATEAARQALERVQFDPSELKALINCSVSRDFFEPATAAIVHGNLSLPEAGMVMDVSNACIGASDGLYLLSSFIESGSVKAGLVVSGEIPTRLIDSTIDYMLHEKDIDRERLLQLLPSLTLGCGAVAFVLCHESLATTNHRIIGGVSRAATQFNRLCIGNNDYSGGAGGSSEPLMVAESNRLMAEAAKLGGRTWREASEVLGWRSVDIDHVFCHQVGKQVNVGFYQEMGLDIRKEFTVYKTLGNLVSAAMPAALILGSEEKGLKENDKILLTAFGSGLNSLFTGLVW